VVARFVAGAFLTAFVALVLAKTFAGAAAAMPATQVLSAHFQPVNATSTGGTTTGSTQVTVASTVPRSVPSTLAPPSTTPTTIHNTATTTPTAPRTTTRTIPRTVAPYYPPATAARGGYVPASVPPTTPAPTTTSTTIAAIVGRLPATPATLPLALKGSSAHVSPVFAVLSGVGFFVALLIAAARFFVTRPGGADRQP